MTTPDIRFKGFTGDWEQRKLNEVALSFEYGLNAAAKKYDGINKYIRITDIDDDSREYKDNDLSSPDCDLALADNYCLKEGEILFARTGASVGKTYIYKNTDGHVYYAGFLIRAIIKSEYNSEFVFQNTLSTAYKRYIAITSQRSGQPGVNAQEYADYAFCVPQYAEQKSIGVFLRQIDYIITLHQRKLDTLKNYKKAMLVKMFPREGKKVPEIRFKGFTGDWEQRKLSEIADRVTRKNDKLESELPLTISAQYGLIDQIEFFDKRIASKNVSGYYLVKKGEFAYNKSTSTDAPWGAVKRLDRYEKGVLSTLYIVFALKDSNVNSDFLTCYYDTVNWYKQVSERAAEGARNHGLLNISAEDFLETSLFLPKDIEEQKSVGLFLKRFDNLITLHQRKLDKLKNLKQSMLNKMFAKGGN